MKIRTPDPESEVVDLSLGTKPSWPGTTGPSYLLRHLNVVTAVMTAWDVAVSGRERGRGRDQFGDELGACVNF